MSGHGEATDFGSPEIVRSKDTMRIPRRLGHIWVGPFQPPVEWMNTWREKHPEWTYTLYDNAYLKCNDFETWRQIKHYARLGWYNGVSDLMRYEILWKEGGFIAEADSICLHPTDHLFEDGFELYTIYENEFLRGELVSPILAATPGHPFLRLLIDTLKEIDPEELDAPWKSTGNKFVAEMIRKHKPEIKIWPSYTMIPQHPDGWQYEGEDLIYARQLFGSTTKQYRVRGLYSMATVGIHSARSLLYKYHLRSKKKRTFRG